MKNETKVWNIKKLQWCECSFIIWFYITKQTGSWKRFPRPKILTALPHALHSAEEIPLVSVEFHSLVRPEPSPSLYLQSHRHHQTLLWQRNTDGFCWGLRAEVQSTNIGGQAWVGGWRERRSCVQGWALVLLLSGRAQQSWGTTVL